MNALAQHNNRLGEIERELWAIDNEESARYTIIEGRAFDHEAWLATERNALKDRKEDLEQTINLRGEFVGDA